MLKCLALQLKWHWHWVSAKVAEKNNLVPTIKKITIYKMTWSFYVIASGCPFYGCIQDDPGGQQSSWIGYNHHMGGPLMWKRNLSFAITLFSIHV